MFSRKSFFSISLLFCHLNAHFICSSSNTTYDFTTLEIMEDEQKDTQIGDGAQLKIMYGAIVVPVIAFTVLF